MIVTLIASVLVVQDGSVAETVFQKLIQHIALPPFKHAPKIESETLREDGKFVDVNAGSFSFWCFPSGRLKNFHNGWALRETQSLRPTEVLTNDQVVASLREFLAISGNGDLEFKVVETDRGLAVEPNGDLSPETRIEAQVLQRGVRLAGFTIYADLARKSGQVIEFTGPHLEPPLPPKSLKPAVGAESAEGTALARHAEWFPESSPIEICTELVIFAEARLATDRRSRW